MAGPFITRQDLTDYLGRDVTADNGALFAVESACEIVKITAEQNFDQVIGDVAILDGTGTDCLLLPEMPVQHAGTVVVDGRGTVTDYVLGDNGRLLRKCPVNGTAGWWLTDWGWWGGPYIGPPLGYQYQSVNYLPRTPVWPMGRQNVQVTYDHGGTAVPQPARAVALALAARIVVQGVTVAETVGSSSVRYAGPAMDLTKGELAILRRYRPTR